MTQDKVCPVRSPVWEDPLNSSRDGYIQPIHILLLWSSTYICSAESVADRQRDLKNSVFSHKMFFHQGKEFQNCSDNQRIPKQGFLISRRHLGAEHKEITALTCLRKLIFITVRETPDRKHKASPRSTLFQFQSLETPYFGIFLRIFHCWIPKRPLGKCVDKAKLNLLDVT